MFNASYHQRHGAEAKLRHWLAVVSVLCFLRQSLAKEIACYELNWRHIFDRIGVIAF